MSTLRLALLALSFNSRKAAEACVKYLNGTVLDDRAVRVDHDWGFVEGRQWGRGRSGGQVGFGTGWTGVQDDLDWKYRLDVEIGG